MYARKWYTANREKLREQSLIGKYGVDLRWWNKMLLMGCWLCGLPFTCDERKSIHVDHDHKTGKVRGLAHRACNLIAGLSKDDVDLLVRIASRLATQKESS